MTVVIDKKSGLRYREGTFDLHLIREVTSYKLLEPTAKDVILDIGACIGSFTSWARKLDARVIAFEPFLESYELLKLNAPHDQDNVYGAVTVGKDSAILYVADSINHGIHSTIFRRGRATVQVPGFDFYKLLKTYQPNKIKLDAEGVEHELLEKPLPRSVKRLSLEYHLTKTGWRESAAAIHRRLISDGFYALRAPRITKVNWTTLGTYERSKMMAEDTVFDFER